MNDTIRRKIDLASTAGADGGPGADHGWRLAFARAARDRAGMMVDVVQLTMARRSLAELLELPPDRALLALLDGPGEGLGLIGLSPDVMSALIEMQTVGKVSPAAPPQRRPTRTDAAMVAGVIDRALEELEAVLAEEADLVWAGGFRYASFLEDPRPLGLLLEDHAYRVLTADLSLAGGARTGQMILALPAEGRGRRPASKAAQPDQSLSAPAFSAALGEIVQGADCRMDAVMARLTLPLREVMALTVGQVLALPQAALDQISVEGIDGRRLAVAQLGQHRGMRAVRLRDVAGSRMVQPAVPRMVVETAPAAAPHAGAEHLAQHDPGLLAAS